MNLRENLNNALQRHHKTEDNIKTIYYLPVNTNRALQLNIAKTLDLLENMDCDYKSLYHYNSQVTILSLTALTLLMMTATMTIIVASFSILLIMIPIIAFIPLIVLQTSFMMKILNCAFPLRQTPISNVKKKKKNNKNKHKKKLTKKQKKTKSIITIIN